MRITKVKLVKGGDEVEIAFTEERKGGEEETTFKSDSLPHPDLLTPWKAVVPHVLQLLGFELEENGGDGEDPEEWELRSVRFKARSEMTEVEFTVMRPIPTHTRTLVINTPGWKMAESPEADEDGPMPVALRRLVRTVRSESKEYVDGKRAQGELELQEEG
jgi:hypothetical protein